VNKKQPIISFIYFGNITKQISKILNNSRKFHDQANRKDDQGLRIWNMVILNAEKKKTHPLYSN
jgi:hypothetical protein